MRYRRGSITVSDEHDLPILRTVHLAGHVRFAQLFEFLYRTDEKRVRDTLCWRVRRLIEHRLLMKSTPAGMNDLVLSIGDAGELYLQNRESFHVEGATRSRGAGNRHQIWHDVELFDIQLALRRAGVVAMWESEPEIRAANDLTTHHYAKDYDAVVTFQSGDRRGRWALEYERTPKWSKEYERIRAALQHEEKVDGFLYLVRSVQAQAFLLHALRGARPQILVGLARAFAHNPFHASLINVATQLACTLNQHLGEAG